jgi:hypothetical protein
VPLVVRRGRTCARARRNGLGDRAVPGGVPRRAAQSGTQGTACRTTHDARKAARFPEFGCRSRRGAPCDGLLRRAGAHKHCRWLRNFASLGETPRAVPMADAPRLARHHPYLGYFAHSAPAPHLHVHLQQQQQQQQARRASVVVAKGMGRIEVVVMVPDASVADAGASASASAAAAAAAAGAVQKCWWTSASLLDRTNPYVGYLAHSRSTGVPQDIFTRIT